MTCGKSKILAPILLVCLPACATAPSPRELGFELPDKYDHTMDQAPGAPDPFWWTAFCDPALDAMMVEAMAANHELAAGVERVAQARAELRIAGAYLLPQAYAVASGSHNFDGGQDFHLAAGLVSYQLDLFGANRAKAVSAGAAFRGSIFDQRTLALTVQADVASNWFSVLALDARLDLTRRSLAAAERILALTERRQRAGAASEIDWSRQNSSVASTRASIAALEQQRVQTVNAIAILLGRPPEHFEIPTSDFERLMPPDIGPGIPSELLLRRPDLMSAEAALDGADADIRAARAAFFPTIDLGVALATIAPLTGGSSVLFSAPVSVGSGGGGGDTQIAQVSGTLIATLFSGGRLEGGLEKAKARQRELVSNYRQSILEALGDVENALADVQSTAIQTGQQAIAARDAKRAARLSELRYQQGADDLLAVLDAQRTELSAEDSLAQARLAQLTSAVDLFKALGGGWRATTQTIDEAD